MFGELTSREIEETIHSQVIGRIGCHADDLTYVVPLSYAYDGEYIYGHTREGLKVNMMRKNHKVCFEVDVLTNLANWKSVIAWGEFEELNNSTDRHHALQHLLDRILPVITSATTKISPEWPFIPADMNSIKGVVFRIRLKQKTGRFESNSTPSFMSWG